MVNIKHNLTVHRNDRSLIRFFVDFFYRKTCTVSDECEHEESLVKTEESPSEKVLSARRTGFKNERKLCA